MTHADGASRPRFGIAVFDYPLHDVVSIAVAAERAGFHSLWLGEHILHPVGYESSHPPVATQGVEHRTVIDGATNLNDVWVTMGALAVVTQRLRLVTGVHVLPLRHPLLTARAAATMHDLSKGRFSLGIGVGWLREEFEALGASFEDRGNRFEEGVALLRAAFAGGPFEYAGAHHRIAPVQITAERIDVPLIMGGNSERALRRAARLADGYVSSGRSMSFEDTLRLRDRLVAHREQAGRTEPFPMWFRVGERELDDLDQYRREGMDDLVIRAT